MLTPEELGLLQQQLQEWRRVEIWNRLKWKQEAGEQQVRAIWRRLWQHYANLPDIQRLARSPICGEWREKLPHAPEHDPEKSCWSCYLVSLKGYIHLENRKLRRQSNEQRAAFARCRIPRETAQALGEETVAILQAGYYVTAAGARVDIQPSVAEAVRGTVSYPPEQELPKASPHFSGTVVEVWNETTLGAVAYLRGRGLQPAALNFASARTPGGGFLRGARAQEEYLARSSALWACLRDNPMYSYHRTQRDPFYSDYVIYSPNVPILRNDAGELLDAPYPCAIITSPAVNAAAVRRYSPARLKDIPAAMKNRILKVLAVAERHGHESLVLGAWGCGAFGNNSPVIAKLFREALETDCCGAFQHVVFAITDWSEDKQFIGPFRRQFGNGRPQFSAAAETSQGQPALA